MFLDSLDLLIFKNIFIWTGEYYAKWNKPVGERQIPYDLTHKRNLTNKVN